jgi:glucose-1-phosphate adenylyltransferase
MARTRVLAIIQAGGSGGRMDVLTRERAKPALPFAAVYNLVDFPLSNLAHSGIQDVWLSVQFQGASIEEPVANGRPWDLDRNLGGFRLLMPEQGTGSADEDGFAQGNGDELFRIRDQIRSSGCDALVVLSADHVYRFDYMDAVDTHRRTGAECTVVTTEVSLDDAGQHAVVEHDEDGVVTGFDYKPENPSTSTVATEVFVYDPEVLVEVLEQLHRERSQDSDECDSGLGDFGESLVPRLVERGHTVVHRLPGYWRDLGQPHLYLAAHQEILLDDQGLFDDPAWPIMTRQPQRVPARVLGGADVEDSLLAPGSRVAGTVRRSVLGPGVRVEPGAVVRNSVVFADTVVCTGATVDWAIVDQDCVIGAGAVVGREHADGTRSADEVTIVGRDSRVDGPLEAAARLEPGTT